MQKTIPVLVLLVATGVRADPLSDLKAALARLTGLKTVTATFDVSRSRHAKGRFLTQDFDGSATFDAEMSPAGVRISLPRTLMDRANDEAWLAEVNPSRTAPTSQALEEVVPQAVERALDYAKPLQRLVARGTVIEQRPDRSVVFQLPKRSGGDRSIGTFTMSEDTLTIWVGADGMPVASRRVRRGTAGILFLKIEMTRTENTTYAVHGDHLVVTKNEDAAAIDGPGSQKGTARSVWVVRNLGSGT